MKKLTPLSDRILYLFLLPAVLFTLATGDRKVWLPVAVLAGLGILINEIRLFIGHRKKKKLAHAVVDMLNMTSQKRLVDFPLPVIISDEKGDILWYNEAFIDSVGEEAVVPLYTVRQLDDTILDNRVTELEFNGKFYSSYMDCYKFSEHREMFIFYLFDTTDYFLLHKEHELSRPVVAHLIVDNYDEVFTGMKESERSAVMALIDEEIDAWAQASGGILCHSERERYLFVFENRALAQFERDRFDIMDRIRAIKAPGNLAPTISIGVGADAKSFAKGEETARAALDMALSRGGDQTAVKHAGGYFFYGGRNNGGERRTRVRTRVIANAFSEHLKTIDTVLIMGHTYGDMDCLGAAVGVARIAVERAILPRIVVDESTDLTGPLLQALKEDPAHTDWFVNRKEAADYLGERTAVIMVDTHRPESTVAPELLKKAQTVFVIDHHRKGVDCIKKPQLFYHEPYASSTCEMVTELFHYMDVYEIPPLEANALLAGIFLDTKNFTVRTNTCTFDASATLRKTGADTVTVKKYFQTDMETYRNKVLFVSNAELYRKYFAIAYLDGDAGGNLKIAAAQAADEMLSIENAKASFTLFSDRGGNVNISARSYGEINVQLIMEKFPSGGGHLTMAGAFAAKTSMEEAQRMLRGFIDQYIAESSQLISK